ncbi:MAG: signal transduction histidine kinase/type II secretory pathway pseudopilin PulG [Phenylobacterium sp.]|jgi:signal transduction histidine kinase/type II secretory pathway pseudopilin PulG
MSLEQPLHDNNSEQRKKLVKAGSLHWVHWLVVVLSILLTLGAWFFSKEQLAQKVEQQFQRQANQVVELVTERMALYENALWGGVSMIASNNSETSYDQWKAYANSLHIGQTYPGINGIGVIFNVQPAQMEQYLHKERLSRPDYGLHPQHQQAEFWPITYIEPYEGNQGAVGLDMAFETNRYTSILKARDSGAAQVTGPITLVQDAKKTPGFLFYAPFYKDGLQPTTLEARRANIIGVTYAPFIMENLMNGTLARQKRQVGIRLSDGDELLFEDASRAEQPMYSKHANVQMYGRSWDFNIWSKVEFEKSASSSQPYFILIGGVVIDSLLVALFVFLSRANRTALALADEMTRELEEKTIHLEKSNHDLEQFSYVASHDLKSPLRGIDQLTTWISEDIDDKEQTEGHLKLMRNRVHRMENLLDDLLTYARIGQEESKIQQIDSKEVIESLYDLMSPPTAFTLKLEGDFPVFDTSYVPFQLVFRNLINNAIKHHHSEDGTVTISVAQKNGLYEFKVQDDGPGISVQYHEKIFALFQTLKPRDEVEGSGMGLAIIKRMVGYLGTDIHVTSVEGEGTCFTVTWPMTIDLNPKPNARAIEGTF